jgi:hypothetical protein
MSPGTYLAETRIQAGVDHVDVAVLWRLLDLDFRLESAPELLNALETNRRRASARELMALRLAFPVNPGTYRRLCAEADARQAASSNERNGRDG